MVFCLPSSSLLMSIFRMRQNVYGFLNKAFKITGKVIGNLFKSTTRHEMFLFRATYIVAFDRPILYDTPPAVCCVMRSRECDKTTVNIDAKKPKNV